MPSVALSTDDALAGVSPPPARLGYPRTRGPLPPCRCRACVAPRCRACVAPRFGRLSFVASTRQSTTAVKAPGGKTRRQAALALNEPPSLGHSSRTSPSGCCSSLNARASLVNARHVFTPTASARIPTTNLRSFQSGSGTIGWSSATSSSSALANVALSGMSTSRTGSTSIVPPPRQLQRRPENKVGSNACPAPLRSNACPGATHAREQRMPGSNACPAPARGQRTPHVRVAQTRRRGRYAREGVIGADGATEGIGASHYGERQLRGPGRTPAKTLT